MLLACCVNKSLGVLGMVSAAKFCLSISGVRKNSSSEVFRLPSVTVVICGSALRAVRFPAGSRCISHKVTLPYVQNSRLVRPSAMSYVREASFYALTKSVCPTLNGDGLLILKQPLHVRLPPFHSRQNLYQLFHKLWLSYWCLMCQMHHVF